MTMQQLVLVSMLTAVVSSQQPDFLELGSVIKQGQYATIDKTIFMDYTYKNESRRVMVSFNTIKVGQSNFTKIYYKAKLPFTADGCMPTFVVKPQNGSGLITAEALASVAKQLDGYFEKNAVIIFDSNTESIEEKAFEQLRNRKVRPIVAFFGENELTAKLFEQGFMVVVNLVKKPVDALKTYWSYLFVYDLVRNDVPMLANLVLVEQGKSYQWCNENRQMAVMTHSFVGETAPIYKNAFERPSIIDNTSTTLKFYDHYGSHFDTPNHFARIDLVADNLPVKYTYAPCIKVQQNPEPANRLKMEKAEFVKWEDTAKMRIPENAFVFAQTGHGKFWGETEYLIAGDDKSLQEYPEINTDAIEWLVKERKVLGVGYDTLGPDAGNPNSLQEGFPVHSVLSDAESLIIENVANMEALPNAEGLLETNEKQNDNSTRIFYPIGRCLLVSLRMENSCGVPYGLFAHFGDLNSVLNQAAAIQQIPVLTNLCVIVMAMLSIK